MREPDSTQLAAIEAIHQLKARYCRFIDTKQWTRLAELFAPGATVEGFGSAPDGASAEEFVAGAEKFLGPALAIHHVQAPEISFHAPDKARGIWSMMDYVDFQPADGSALMAEQRGWIGWGYYEEEYVRIDGAWLIAFMRLARQRMDPLADDHPLARAGRRAPTRTWI